MSILAVQLLQACEQIIAELVQRIAVLLPLGMNLLQNIHQSDPTQHPPFREIRSRIKRLFVRRQQHRQRPPPAPGQRLTHRHIQPVNIRPLLAVDFDGYEVVVEELGDILVLEGFSFHYMTPMAYP
ncbi:hypothetical protein D3C80_1830510 [compost metagenome]